MSSVPAYSVDDLPLRFRKKISINAETGCWEWIGARDRGGYGSVGWQRRTLGAHRVVYILLAGEIPAGLELDHVRARGCIFRHCVNPAHLEPVTVRVNRQRQELGGTAGANRAKTHCVNGHEFSEENTHIRPDGARSCKTCDRLKTRKAYRKAAERDGRGLPPGERTHCPQGHPYDEENTYRRKGSNTRSCRACHRETERERYRDQRKKAAL